MEKRNNNIVNDVVYPKRSRTFWGIFLEVDEEKIN